MPPLQAQVILVSAACHDIFGCPAAELLGDYEHWLKRVHPDDRELVIAAVAQLGLQPQPIRCEYRLNPAFLRGRDEQEKPIHPPLRERWVRDTLAPNYGPNGKLEGWEGVVEDITAQRDLAHDLQRTSNMLHTLVANLPAGVFFVHGQKGQPLLVNARARHLLGQREDPSAGIAHWPRIYRLHRSDGTLYPWEELPVYKALKQGLTTMRDDIIIHRADGRRVPLVTWAAPIYLGESGKIEAAVWVFEDLTSLQQADAAHLESEARLRTVFQTMAEGLIIQDQHGIVTECNQAACALLGLAEEELIGRPNIGFEGCLREDGTPLPRDEQPDLVCLQTRQPVRNVVLGLRAPQTSEVSKTSEVWAESRRWLLVNCMPLLGGQTARAGFSTRVVTTLTDVTHCRQ